MEIKALGLNTEKNWCVMIYSKASFLQLKDDFELYNKKYSATNWNGRDDINRTLKIQGLKLTGREFNYTETINGSDMDMGHEYYWHFTFNKVVEVVKDEGNK